MQKQLCANLVRRIETTIPILDPALRKRVSEQILSISLGDNVKAWTLDSEGKYHRRTPGSDPPRRSQEQFIEIAREEAFRLVGPYEEIIRRPGSFRRKAKRKKKH